MWMPTIMVLVGGGLGAIVREFSMLLFSRESAAFPVDIFAVNMLASLVLGLAFGRHRGARLSDNATLFVSTGLFGGMSTFSTFTYGSYPEMTTPGGLGLSLAYVIASLVIGYSVTWLGLNVATRIRRA